MKEIRFATWNIRLSGTNGRFTRQKLDKLRALRESGFELIALQQVFKHGFGALQELRGSGAFPHLFPETFPEVAKADRACAILAAGRFDAVDQPRNIKSLPFPERSCIVSLRSEGEVVTVASFHFVPGRSQRRNRGPIQKRKNFRLVASWLATQDRRTIVGLDCNSPRVDHPLLSSNQYFRNRRGRMSIDQEEYLLHDPSRAPPGLRHCLVDAYRRYLDAHPSKLREAVKHFEKVHKEQRQGCLATSHIAGHRERRFAYIYITPDLRPVCVDYRPVAEVQEAGSRHGIVVAELRPGKEPPLFQNSGP